MDKGVEIARSRWHFFVFALFIFGGVLFQHSMAEAKTIWCNPANSGTEDGLAKESGYSTLWEAMAAMSSGDTVIIANGDWQDYPAMSIDNANVPPSGTAEAYSKITAETDWQVRVHHCNSATSRQYVEIRGLVFDSRTSPISNIVYEWNHTKFIRCGFLVGKITGNNHTCGFGSADHTRSLNHHNLMEECIAWGGGRYVFYQKYGQYNIFRRCIARHDNQEGSGLQDDGQIANFRAYADDYAIYQNCISIDSDRVANYNGGIYISPEASGFWVGDQYSSNGSEIVGSISIKDLQMPFYFAGGAILGTTIIHDSVALSPTTTPNTASTLSAFILKNNNNVIASKFLGVDEMRAGQDGYYGKNGGTFTISDSIMRDVADVGIPASIAPTSDHILYYNSPAGDYGTNSVHDNPFTNGLLYPVRVETGSTLATAGSNASVLGPTILKRIGVSGTLYGETGWNKVTDENLWPFPNEDKIRDLMRTTVDGVDGAYGFCADGQTLSNYIWGYFGNTVPPFNVRETSPNAGSVIIQWDPPADIARPTITGYKIYDVKNGKRVEVASVTGNNTFQATINGLTIDQHYELAMTAIDSTKGESGISYVKNVSWPVIDEPIVN